MASSVQRVPGCSPTSSAAMQQPGCALAPEDGAVGVGDEHDVHGLVGDAHERAAQERHHRVERVRRAQVGQFGVLHDHGRGALVGVDLRGEAPLPRLGHERARRHRAGFARQHGVEHLVEQVGAARRGSGCRAARRAACTMSRHQHSERHRPRTRPIITHVLRLQQDGPIARATSRQRRRSITSAHHRRRGQGGCPMTAEALLDAGRSRSHDSLIRAAPDRAPSRRGRRGHRAVRPAPAVRLRPAPRRGRRGRHPP